MVTVNEQNQLVGPEGQVINDPEGKPYIVEGIYRKQEDVDRAVQKRTDDMRKKVETLTSAVEQAEGAQNKDAEQIKGLQTMLETAKKDLETDRIQSTQKSREQMATLTTENTTLREERDTAVKDRDNLIVDTAILGQASIEGRSFVKPIHLIHGIRESATFVDNLGEDGKKLGTRKLLFRTNVPRTTKHGDIEKDQSGQPIIDEKLLQVDKAAELYANANPEVVVGKGTGGSGGSGQASDKGDQPVGLEVIYNE